MSDALNMICINNDLGIRFSVVIVPGGQQYTLASAHLIDSYMGGWIADYNHVLNWLAAMYLSTGIYCPWNLWNLTALDTRYADALLADRAGDVNELLRLNNEMNEIANEALMYMVWWHPTLQFARSEWLQGWYVNVNYGVDLWSTMYYETPEPDVTPPTSEIDLSGDLGEGGWFTSEVLVTLSATDNIGVGRTEYSFDNTSWITYSAPFNLTEEGYISIYYRSADNYGNVETVKMETTKVDMTAPTGSILINNDGIYTNSSSVTLSLSAVDVTSGVALTRLSHDNITWTPSEAYTTLRNWTLTEGDGWKTVYAQYADNAGLVSQSTDTITLDTTSPAITITSPSSGSEIRSSTVPITWTDSDETAGMSHCEVKLDDGSWTNVGSNAFHIYTGIGEGSHIVEVKATDKAGLSTKVYVEFIVNTSPLFGPGYIEEAAITATIVAVVLGTTLYFFKFRKRT